MLNKKLLVILILGIFNISAYAEFNPKKPECIAPAKPGGGFDLTCRIAVDAFKSVLDKPLKVTFMPGGIGAVAYNYMNTRGLKYSDTIVAFSSGSILNLAQKKFGKQWDENDARWLAAAGADYGAIIVNADSKWRTLTELVEDIKANPKKYVFGAGGSVGSQDWMKVALLFKSAGLDIKQMKYVPYEGGGDAIAALLGNVIQVYPGDVAEMKDHLDSGKMRILAVLSKERLSGIFNKYPTAKEQGYDFEWVILRGYYMGADVSDESYNWWVNKFDEIYEDDNFKKIREDKGLFPFNKSGKDFDKYVKNKVQDMKVLAKEAGLSLK